MASESSHVAPSGWRWPLVGGLVLALLIAAAYGNSLQAVYLFDDRRAVIENPRVTELQPLSTYFSSSRGIPDLSFALTHAAAGGHHRLTHRLINILIHFGCALTAFGLLRRLLRAGCWGQRWGSRADALALAIVGLWAVHPLTTQAVTYLVQRHESLMALFYLLTVYMAVRAMSAQNEGSRWAWSMAAVLACCLGMGSKQVMATAPLMVLLIDRSGFAGSFALAFRRRWALHTALMATWGILFYQGLWQTLFPDVPERLTDAENISAGFGMPAVSAWAYLSAQPGIILHYLRLSVWPQPLVLDYEARPPQSVLQIVVTGGLIAGMLGLSLWQLARRRGWGLLGMGFFLILAPTSSFIPITDLIMEHRMYLPLLSVLATIVLGAVSLADRLGVEARLQCSEMDSGRGSRPRRPNRWRRAGWGMVLAAAVGLILVCRDRNRDYLSREGMWRQNVAARPETGRPYVHLGDALRDQGQTRQAAQAYRRATQHFPRYPTPRLRLARVQLEQAQAEAAVRTLRRLVALLPEHDMAHAMLGYALGKAGDHRQAVAALRRAVELRPKNAEYRHQLARSLTADHRPQEALPLLRAAIDRYTRKPDPDRRLPAAWLDLGHAFSQLDQLDQAQHAYEQALSHDPDRVAALRALTRHHLHQQDTVQARAYLRRWLEVAPNHPEANTLRRELSSGLPATQPTPPEPPERSAMPPPEPRR